ncbi:ABC transporter substrate-binding protein [Marinactinospora rubrisoli]|uniref:ABC transporter substrate-binding protein n=1 Tax=Marinactinospora rubrisoli TaxID=2715399 RepID=A0ABW2KD12_9ACTN
MRSTRFLGRRWTAPTVLLLATALVATGCGGGGEDGPVELRYSWWGNADRAELMREAIDLFEAEHPDITITPTFSEYNAYWEKLSTEAAGGGMADVAQMDISYLREYADRGLLLDLSELEGNGLDTGDLVDGFEQAGVIDDARYAVPVAANTFALFYVPELFEAAGAPAPEPGWSWDDYHEAIAAVTEHTGGEPYGGADYTGLIWALELQLRQEGGELFTEDGRLAFDEPRLAEFWNETAGFREDEIVVPAAQYVQAQPVSPLGANIGASEFNWDNFLARYEGEADAEVALAPVPTSDPERSGQYLRPSMMLAASSQTEHPEQAAELIDFLINSPEVGELFGGNRGIPATNVQRESARLDGVDRAIADYEEERAADLRELPPVPPAGMGSLEAEFIRLSEEVGYGRLTPQDAAGEFFAFADRTLSS